MLTGLLFNESDTEMDALSHSYPSCTFEEMGGCLENYWGVFRITLFRPIIGGAFNHKLPHTTSPGPKPCTINLTGLARFFFFFFPHI